jgi:hypothetical protein
VQKADSALSIAQKLLQERSTKQGEITRESSRLEIIIQGLTETKEALEKKLGALEGQQPKPFTGGQ